MQLLDLTLETAAANLALDEALLNSFEQRSVEPDAANRADGILRLWAPASTAVVVGRSSQVADEVDQAFCRQQNIPILRRTSGGASVLTGPGCLMYSLILDLGQHAELRVVSAAHRFVLGRIQTALRGLSLEVEISGVSDLTVADRKVSGNSLRVLRNTLLYHGALLHDFPLALIGKCLRTAPRQPDYRRGRSHDEFVANLNAEPDGLKSAIMLAFGAEESLSPWPAAATQQLVVEKYSNDNWNFCR